MEPPLGLHPRCVHAIEAVIHPSIWWSIARWGLPYFTAKSEFVHRAAAAVGTGNQERHYRPNTFLVPTRGRLQMAEASSVRAAMSSGSRRCTSDFPQESASIWT